MTKVQDKEEVRSPEVRRPNTVVFDLGGVLIDWNPRYLYRKLFNGDEPAMEDFLTNICSPAWNKQQDAGRSFAEGCASLRAIYPEASHHIDAWFEPKEKVREAACRVAQAEGVDSRWLNDGVKGFLSDRGTFNAYLSLSHLHIFTALPDYLLAMKCMSFRIGHEYTDEEDVRFLLRYLNVETFDIALEIVERYYPREMIPQKTFHGLREIFAT